METDVTQTDPMNLYDRLMGAALPAIVGLTPFVIYGLERPDIGQARFFQAATLLLTISLGLAWLVGWRPFPGRVTFAAALIILNITSVAVSFSNSRDVLFSLKKYLLPLCGYLFFMSLALHPRRRLVLERIGLVLLPLGGLLALYGTLQYFEIDFYPWLPEVQKNKVIATIGHPNFLASVLGPITFFALGMIFVRRNVRWVLGGGLLIFLILGCMLLARTRGVWLGMVVGLALMFCLLIRYGLKHRVGLRLVRGLIVGATLLIISLSVALFVVLPRLGEVINFRDRIASTYEIKSRFFYWRAAVELAMEKRYTGQGYAMFQPIFWDYTLRQQQSETGPFYYDFMTAISGRNPHHVHNEYLEVFSEQGIPGLALQMALLLFFLYFGYFAIMRQPDPKRALRCIPVYSAYVMILIDAVFSFPWRLPVSLIIFMVVLAWLYDEIYPQPRDQQAGPRAA